MITKSSHLLRYVPSIMNLIAVPISTTTNVAFGLSSNCTAVLLLHSKDEEVDIIECRMSPTYYLSC